MSVAELHVSGSKLTESSPRGISRRRNSKLLLTAMFGAFPINPRVPSNIDPQDIPGPTPITLPRYQPFAQDDLLVDQSQSLPQLLKQTGRESIVLGATGLLAIGLDLKLDVDLKHLVPPASCLPDFHQWDKLTAEEAQNQGGKHQFPLRNGVTSPGVQVYLERRRELANTNEDAFRTVRRLSPPRGKQQARLGNAYEFFRCLELFTAFWDDPSQPEQLPPSPELTGSRDDEAADPDPDHDHDHDHEPESHQASAAIYRTCSGEAMPAEYRQTLLNAFVKLVAYDFGCSVSVARTEPRLHFSSPSGRRQRKSYTSSDCHFVFQIPRARETARAGVVHGPVAAVSTRPTVSFTTPDAEAAQSQDLAREVVAALITAQHRNREGREETRFGDQQWWTTRHRWGGGVGGPIGREIEKEAVASKAEAGAADKTNQTDNAGDGPVKKPRKTMPIYDRYRKVRPPASSWDQKARYEAIGKVKGAGYDDIFLISSLFHHLSILRVRVPFRLLEVLDGSPEQDATRRSWGRVEAWRSPWFDFFDVGQRIRAMQLVWAVMAYQMRRDD